MSKVIAVGQACLDILHEEGRQVCSFVGGRIANMAMALSHDGVEVEFVSECATDGVGDMIVDTLKKNGVGVKSVDRFTEAAVAGVADFPRQGGQRAFLGVCEIPRLEV